MIETQLFNCSKNICKQIQFSIRFNSIRLGGRYAKTEMQSGFGYEISAIRRPEGLSHQETPGKIWTIIFYSKIDIETSKASNKQTETTCKLTLTFD